jgi:hypothetical protein
MSLKRMHYYLATALITYVRDPDSPPKQRHMNIVMQTPDKHITSGTIDQARAVLLQRMIQETQITAENLKDLVFLGFSYLGHMSSKEFHDTADAPAANPYDA